MLGKLFAGIGIDESLQHLLPEIPKISGIGIDESLQHLVPNVLPDSWYGEHTFDNKGLLHSFDDTPIRMAKASWSNIVEFRWYSHGSISRADNLPPIISVSPKSYSTLNQTSQLHSYNGMPSKIEFIEEEEIRFSWHVNDELHMDGLLPASTTYDLDGNLRSESFYVNGRPHRGNSLPSEVSAGIRIWTVQGIQHNATGFSEGFTDASQGPNLFTWCLYGVEMAEKVFNSIRKLAADKSIPLYAAFLVSMRVITFKHLNSFMNSEGEWKTEVPVTWVLRALNVTAENFSEKINEEASWNSEVMFAWNVNSEAARFDGFLRVIVSEEKDAAERLLQNL